MFRRSLARALSALLPAALAVAAPAEGGPDGAPGDAVRENRLARERSPYLRQHATNPVDWHPWGPEALERAKREDRPIFLSIGYAACHWCHVMERESFEDADAAKVLNDVFVCVKVDREERPDLDRLYMTSVQMLTGRGGWPMTVLLLPDGRPFWGGTYLPRASLVDLAKKVREAWDGRRSAVEQQAAMIAEQTAEHARGRFEGPEAAGSDEDLLRNLRLALAAAFDRARGGYGGRPKFPPHAELLFLLDTATGPEGREGLEQAVRTLEAMAEGGIHDHAGGGFHRYSTDERWFLPHFEKMLYDNALLARAYAEAHALTKERAFARVARRTLEWVRREMSRPGGGYASSLDADTQGHEGLTYTWTVDEVRAALGPEDARLAIRVLGLAEGGNFSEEATGRATGRNVLHLPEPLSEVAKKDGTSLGDLEARVDGILGRLLAARARRAQPPLDDKVIVGWNGLLLSAFAAAGSALGDRAWLDEGRRLAEFLWTRCRREDGSLLRFPAGSGPEIPGFCEDHVHLADGLLDLAEATGEDRWAEAARDLADRLISRFQDAEAGGFWTTATGAHEDLFARTKEVWDSPIPSDQAVAARVLLRVAARTGEARYRAAADRTLAAYRPLMTQGRMARGIVALFHALALRAGAESATPADRAGDARVRVGPASVDLFLERGEARRGDRVRFAVRVALDRGWHVNTDAPADPSLVATRLALAAGAPVRLGPLAWPRGKDGRWEGTFWIRGEVEVPAEAFPGPRKVALVLSFQPCDPTSCREPEEARLEAPLRFGDAEGPLRHAAVFAR